MGTLHLSFGVTITEIGIFQTICLLMTYLTSSPPSQPHLPPSDQLLQSPGVQRTKINARKLFILLQILCLIRRRSRMYMIVNVDIVVIFFICNSRMLATWLAKFKTLNLNATIVCIYPLQERPHCPYTFVIKI